ncbi:MAG: AEC family transporter [archaeon]
MGVLAGFAGVWALIALGKIVQLKGILNEDAAKQINVFVLMVAMPALSFEAMYNIESFTGLYWLPVGGLLVALVVTAIAFPAAKMMKLKKQETGSFVISSLLPNVGFLGLPIMAAFFGQAGVEAAVVYIISFNILSPTVVNYISECYGGACPASGKQMLKKVLLFPLFIAFILGIAFNFSGIALPEILMTLVGDVGSITIPLILVSIGVLLKMEKADAFKAVGAIGALRFIVAPLVAYAFGVSVGLSGVILAVLVLESAMPPAIANLSYSIERKLDVKLTLNAIFYLTLASMVALPVIAWLL